MNTPNDYLTDAERAEIETRRASARAEMRMVEKIMARARQRARRARAAQ